jgi:hypothetical protein
LSAVKSSAAAFLVAAGLLAVNGAWRPMRESGPVAEVLGGFRAPAADLLWLEANERAEAGDLRAAEALLRLVTAVDPRPLYFWINAARIIAYDLPESQVASAGVGNLLSPDICRRIRVAHAQRALAVLDEAQRYHPASAALWIERANIQLNRLGDVAGAAESYRQAAGQADAPYFAARLHGELLRRLGREAEALAWLVRLHPTLPPANEAAGAGLVLARIRALERELGVTAARAYPGFDTTRRAGQSFGNRPNMSCPSRNQTLHD